VDLDAVVAFDKRELLERRMMVAAEDPAQQEDLAAYWVGWSALEVYGKGPLDNH
jgi:hypothetical protein